MNNERFVEINATIVVFLGLGNSNKVLVGGDILFAEAIAPGFPLAELVCKVSVQDRWYE
jgi:hypothetical protein